MLPNPRPPRKKVSNKQAMDSMQQSYRATEEQKRMFEQKFKEPQYRDSGYRIPVYNDNSYHGSTTGDGIPGVSMPTTTPRAISQDLISLKAQVEALSRQLSDLVHLNNVLYEDVQNLRRELAEQQKDIDSQIAEFWEELDNEIR